MCGLRNIKISVKILHFDYNVKIDFLKERYNSKNEANKFKAHNNFIVVNDTFTYILFKPKKKGEECHLNITKICSFDDIQPSINLATKIFECTYNPHSVRIDNMTYLHYLRKQIKLGLLFKKYHKSFQIKYNNTIFPGLHLKTKTGSAIIFHTGTVIIVGCKNIKQVSDIISIVEQWTVNTTGL